MSTPAERIAAQFHAAYEELAPEHGYKTREASAKPWAEVPEDNRSLMIATVQQLLDAHMIELIDVIDMSFAGALRHLRDGRRVTRASWPAGLYVALQAGYPDGIKINGNTAQATGQPEGTLLRFQPYLMLRDSDGSFVPWSASIPDLLADDWKACD